MVKRLIGVKLDEEMYNNFVEIVKQSNKTMSDVIRELIAERLKGKTLLNESKTEVKQNLTIVKPDITEDKYEIVKSALKVKESSEKLKALIEQAESSDSNTIS